MTTHSNRSNLINPWRIAGWTGALAILLTPLVAMQFSDDVDWSLMDFVIIGALMIGIGAAFELAVRASSNMIYRLAAGIGLLASLMLIWINLAVGVIGTEDSPANLLYLVVLGIGVAGAFVSQLDAKGMSRTLLAMAIAHALITLLALNIDPRIPVTTFNTCFTLTWLTAAGLFRRAGRVE